MAATTIDVIRRLTVQGQSVGLDKVTADLNKVEAGQERVAQSSARLVSASATVERSSLSAQRSLDSYTRSLDPLTRAINNLERGQRAATAVQAQGGTLSEANNRALANAKARVDELRESVEKHTASLGLNRMQQLEAVHVAKSLADQIIAGQSPLRALAVEGGRIGQIFSSGGGVTSTLKGFGSALGGLVNPSVVAAGAILGVATAASTAALAWEDSQRRLSASLEGTGRAAGSTLGQLNAISEAGARAGRISTSQGRELAIGFTRAGISADQSHALIGSTPAFARATGTDVASAGKTLAAAFADPEKGADLLNKSLGFLNDRIVTQIHNAEAAGNLEGARRTALDAYLASLKDITDHTWTLSRIFDQAKINVSNFIDDFGKEAAKAIGGQTPGQELQSLKDRLPYTSSALPGYFNTDFVTKQIDRLQQVVDQQAKADTAAAARRKSEADANTLSLQARDVIRSVLPEIERNETFASQSDILKRVLANPGGLADPGAANRALGNLTVQHAFSDPLTVMRQDAKLALDAVNATSLAERAAIEARRAELQVLRETGDVTRAAAAGQDALNLEIAKANKAADDSLEKAKQNAALVGMSPLQRQLAEIHNRYQDFRDQNASTPKEFSTELAPVQADLRAAGDALAQALRDIAQKVKAPFLSVDGKPVGSPYGSLGGVRVGGAGALDQAPAAIFPMISGAADRTGIDARIIAAIGQRENGFRLTGGTSMLGSDGRPSSAYGFGQLTNAAARDVAAAVPGFDKYNPTTAVFGSAEYLKILVNRNHGDLTAALNAYGGRADYAPDIYRRAGVDGSSSITVRPTIASTAGATSRTAESIEQNAAISGGISDRMTAANNDLKARNDLLAVEQRTLGQTTAQIEAAAEAQKMLNEFSAQGYQTQGPEVWKRVTDAVGAYQQKLAGTIQAEDEFQRHQQQTIQTMDGIRGASRDALGTFVQDLRNGQGAGKALGDVMSGLETRLLNFASDRVINSLFGETGTPGGGALGGSGIFGALSAVFHHDGGIVGRDVRRTAMVDPMIFATAPRHHTGYNLAADERPAILQTGEAVISRADLAAARAQKSAAQAAAATPAGGMGTGSDKPPSIQVIHNNPTKPDVTYTKGPDGAHVFQVMWEHAAAQSAQSNGKGYRALANRTGLGRVG